MDEDIEWDITRLDWLRTALSDVIDAHKKLQSDYPFIGDKAADAAYRAIIEVQSKIDDLKVRLAKEEEGEFLE